MAVCFRLSHFFNFIFIYIFLSLFFSLLLSFLFFFLFLFQMFKKKYCLPFVPLAPNFSGARFGLRRPRRRSSLRRITETASAGNIRNMDAMAMINSSSSWTVTTMARWIHTAPTSGMMHLISVPRMVARRCIKGVPPLPWVNAGCEMTIVPHGMKSWNTRTATAMLTSIQCAPLPWAMASASIVLQSYVGGLTLCSV